MRISDHFRVEDFTGKSVSVDDAAALLAAKGLMDHEKWLVLRGSASPLFVATVAALVREKIPFFLAGRRNFGQCKQLLSRSGFKDVAINFLVCEYGDLRVEKRQAGLPLSLGHGIQCLITTSGTTGRPKPILLRGAAIVSSLKGIFRYTGRAAWAGRVLQVNNPEFDGFLEEVLLTAYAGGTIVIPRTPVRLAPFSIPKILLDESIDAIDLPTGLFNSLASLEQNGASKASVVIVIGGQSFAPAAVNWVRKSLPGALILNTYGPTEATITCSAHLIDAHTGNRQIVGQPYPEVDWRIEPVEGIGSRSEGQLMLSGAQLSPSVANGDHEVWYPTGDRVRLGKDGLEYVGRINSLVKVAGRRVDLALVSEELERRLSTRVNVKTLTSDDGIDSLVVTIYGRPVALRNQDIRTVRSYLRDRSVPVLVRHKEKIHLTERGKEDFEQ